MCPISVCSFGFLSICSIGMLCANVIEFVCKMDPIKYLTNPIWTTTRLISGIRYSTCRRRIQFDDKRCQ